MGNCCRICMYLNEEQTCTAEPYSSRFERDRHVPDEVIDKYLCYMFTRKHEEKKVLKEVVKPECHKKDIGNPGKLV